LQGVKMYPSQRLIMFGIFGPRIYGNITRRRFWTRLFQRSKIWYFVSALCNISH
jgi:hypothetical protein